MIGWANPGLVEEWLKAFIDRYEPFMSLHHDAPSLSSPTHSEVSSGTYRRQPFVWSVVSDRSIRNSNDVRWTGLDPISIGGLGVFVKERRPVRNPPPWVSKDGFAFGVPLSIDESLTVEGGILVLPAGSFRVVL